MDAVSLADAKARFSELVDRAEAGDTILITRRGKFVARLAPAPKLRKRIDSSVFEALDADMKPQAESAADLVRSMRDSDRA